MPPMRSGCVTFSKWPILLLHVRIHDVEINLQSSQEVVMGRRRKGHNWKARLQLSGPTQSTSICDKVVVEDTSKEADGYQKSQGSNALVVPSKKQTFTKKRAPEPGTSKLKKLSKKQRKRLEKIVERKNKKARRVDLLEALQGCAVTDKELALMNSTTQLGKKRKQPATHDTNKVMKADPKVSSIRKSREKRQELQLVKTDSADEVQSGEEEDSEDSSVCSEPEASSLVAVMDAPKMHVEDAAEKHDCVQIALQDPSSVDRVTPKLTIPKEPAVFVEIKRDPEIQAARLQLPILAEEQSVMEAIKGNDVVIICGETGSGKTTQVPQFLFEAGFTKQGLIGVTEPRRVAAVSMSQRIAMEMAMSCDVVSYQIRYEGNTTEETLIKFMTDGVLLKEIEKDFLLSKYSAIILDEAHERSVYTDILIGLLSRILPLRNKQGKHLKLIIMSATLRVADFTSNAHLFPTPPPTVTVESRQFPVSVHFSKRTPEDYLEEAYRKVCKIHRTLPPGGILVFVTGQGEVHSLCRKLRRTFPHTKKLKHEEDSNDATIDLDKYSVTPQVDDRGAEDEELGEEDPGELEEFDLDDSAFTATVDNLLPISVLPLYSLLSSQQQSKVFQPAPHGARLCVVATNVAETSLTIPNIKYVVDTGMVKRRYFDKTTGVSSFKITWTSKASSNQRAGRAGRVEPGHCYRLFSSAVFNNEFEEFSAPEIMRRPVDDLLLQMKDMGIDRVDNFPFPTPPDAESLQAAEKLLVTLGALKEEKTVKGHMVAKITPLGRAMAKFPVSPRYAKMLCLGHQGNCLEYVIALVAALTVREIFCDGTSDIGIHGDQSGMKKMLAHITQLRRAWAGQGEAQMLGDLMVLLRAVGATEYAGCTEEFCHKNGLRHKGMVEIRKLRAQLTNSVNLVDEKAQVGVNPKMKPPSVAQCKTLRQICLAGFADHVARRASAVGLKNAYVCTSVDEPVFIHPSSALFSLLPEYVVYQEIVETSKLYMKGVMAIEPAWLPVLAPAQCTFSKPLEDPLPRYDADSGVVKCHMACTFGPRSWEVPAQELDFPAGLERYKWFARFLLEGTVASGLKPFVPFLLCAPVTMVKSWAKLQPRTESLLKELVSGEADSTATLNAAWRRNSKFLLSAFSQWLPRSKHAELVAAWPPVDLTEKL